MNLKRTALCEWHRTHGKMIPFAGWEMPVKFTSVVDEHLAVRNGVGIFDISHMGRLTIEGRGATPFLEHLLTRDVTRLSSGRCGYSPACNERGGIKDDLVINKFSKDKYIIICNAANRPKILKWLTSLRGFASGLIESASNEAFISPSPDVKIEDKTFSTSLLAVQGPKAEGTLKKITVSDLPERRYSFEVLEVSNSKSVVSRTGYTGEDGFEIIPLNIPNEPSSGNALDLWNSILKAGEEYGIKPCGLGARDTLRLEAGMCLYGNDITEQITPLEARLDFVVNLEKEAAFIGKDALVEQRGRGLEKIRIGFKMFDGGIPRRGMGIMKDGKCVGEVTSGTFSPILRKGIGMGYIPLEYSELGSEIGILIRGREVPARVVELPFYDTLRYGWKRK